MDGDFAPILRFDGSIPRTGLRGVPSGAARWLALSHSLLYEYSNTDRSTTPSAPDAAYATRTCGKSSNSEGLALAIAILCNAVVDESWKIEGRTSPAHRPGWDDSWAKRRRRRWPMRSNR